MAIMPRCLNELILNFGLAIMAEARITEAILPISEGCNRIPMPGIESQLLALLIGLEKSTITSRIKLKQYRMGDNGAQYL